MIDNPIGLTSGKGPHPPGFDYGRLAAKSDPLIQKGADEPDETEDVIYQCFEGFDKVLALALLAPAWNAFGNPTKSPPGQ